jgi:carbamoyl-phosphate synthase large subunit
MPNEAAWIKGAGTGRRDVRILFTSAGRRIELMQAFSRAASSLGLRPHWHTADIDPRIAAACLAEKAHQVPMADAPGYIPALLKIARREKIDLLIPLIDSDLRKLADARERFTRIGCGAIISSPDVVRTCRDKFRMFEFLTRHGIDTPRTWTAAEILRQRKHRFPYFLKPRFGSASMGNHILRDLRSLGSAIQIVPDPLIQEFVAGAEYTLDVYTGFDGRPRCVVPRQRIEVRGGEVTKARTVKHDGIIQAGVRVVEALADCVGLITIQLILSPNGRIRIIEVNPRFGGGIPLAIHAGADFPKWLLAEWLGKQPRIRLDHFQPGLLMLRYHQSFFVDESASRRRYPKGKVRR